MKKTINGRSYDTETAVRIGAGDNGLEPGDFAYYEETLYRKRTGEYFLHGSGAANSKYAESRGQNQWGPGEKLFPLTIEAAKEWAEEHLDSETYESTFGAIQEDDARVVTTISISAETYARLKRMSEEMGLPVSGVVEQLVTKKIQEKV